METVTQTQPPAQPAYVLRGHSAQTHALHFLRQNLRLLTGDADGWVVLWSLPIKRPVVVWRPHSSAILGLASWDEDKVITHGRDGKLCVWQLREQDEAGLSKTLPIEDPAIERRSPWLLHCLTVHSLNFCSFAKCNVPLDDSIPVRGRSRSNCILVALPGVQDGSVLVNSLPEEERVATVPPPKDTKTGMLMAVGVLVVERKQEILVYAGYESGHVAVWRQIPDSKAWQAVYLNKAHSQPVMSLDVASGLDCFFTSSADAIIARHPMQRPNVEMETVQTKHAGQQSLRVRNDGRIVATAGWDGRARVYSAKTMKDLAVLKWHTEGCYSLAFAELFDQQGSNVPSETSASEGQSGLARRETTVSAQRTAKTKSTHWLAVGSKDGKVSLWDIY